MNRAWAWVLAGGLLETTWATGMKLSDGFSSIGWTLFTGVFLVASVLFLNQGFKRGLPAGVCYAVWVGIGAVGSIIVGMALFGEMLSPLGWLCLAVVIGGVIGLNLTESGGDGPSP